MRTHDDQLDVGRPRVTKDLVRWFIRLLQDLDRGLVAITFRSFAVTSLLRAVGGALKGGGVAPTDTLDVRTDLSDLTISGPPFPYQLDGDYLGETEALVFRHVPDAVRLVRPVLSLG